MSLTDDTEIINKSPAVRDLRRDTRELREVLADIEAGIQTINDRLAKGDTALALLEHRVAFLEKLVYGVVGIIGTSLVGALVALVLKVQG